VPEWIESHNSFGVTAPGKRWALAEGRVGGDDSAQTYILLSNPGSTAGVATLTFLRTDGTTVSKTVDVPAASRITVGVTGPDGAAPELVNEAFGTLIESTQPIVAERAQYWGTPVWIESHNSFGVTAPGTRWALAEGRVGGDDGAQTYILLSNPGQTAGSATLTFLRTDGTTVAKTVDLPPASRITFGVTGPQSEAPELVNESFGTRIESTQPIIVERSLYSSANGILWAAGTNATATRLPEPR
jgi:hypothetical protein